MLKARAMRWLQWVGLFMAVSTATASHGTLFQVISNGSPEKRINLVILSEGYQSTERTKFLTDATNSANFFLQTQPFLEYRSYFNFYAIFVPSVDSGSDHPSSNIFKNTYFNSKYDSFGRPELLTIPPNDVDSNPANGETKVHSLAAELLPSYDIPMILVNDPAYGGSAGSLAVVSLHAESRQVFLHEFGHIFAGLGDEYSDPVAFSDIEEPNTTRETNRSLIKWNAWILPTTPIPTPNSATNANKVGLFEGAHYHSTGWYRPKLSCKMRIYSAAFCEVCSEALVKSIYEHVRPIESVSPGNQNLLIPPSQTVSFEVQTMTPRTNRLKIEWLIDGQSILNGTNTTFNFSSTGLSSGTHSLEARVKDDTGFVRNDPEKLLFESFAWNIEVLGISRIINPIAVGDRLFFSLITPPSNFVVERSTNLVSCSAVSTITSATTNFNFQMANEATFFRIRAN